MKNPVLLFLLLMSLSVGAQNYNFSEVVSFIDEPRGQIIPMNGTLILDFPSVTLYMNKGKNSYKVNTESDFCSGYSKKDVLDCYDLIEIKSGAKWFLLVMKDGSKFSLTEDGKSQLIFRR